MVEPLDMGEDEGLVPISVNGKPVLIDGQPVVLDLDDVCNQLIDWRKEMDGKPESERGASLLAMVQSFGVPVTSIHHADQFHRGLFDRWTALKKKLYPGTAKTQQG